MTTADHARDLFRGPYLCSQAVLAAWLDAHPELLEKHGITREAALAMALPFGSGLSETGGVCGAVNGAMMAIGLHSGLTLPDKETRHGVYEKAAELHRRFTELHGSHLCPQLIGVHLGEPGANEQARAAGMFENRCPLFVGSAVEILEDLFSGGAEEKTE